MPTSTKSSFYLADLFIPEIKELLAAREFKEIKKLLKDISLADLADSWEKFEDTEKIFLFRLLTGREASTLFQELEPADQTHLLNSFQNKELENLLDDFNPEEAARIFHALPKKTVNHLYAHLEQKQKKHVDKIFKYPDNSVGSWMRIQNADLKPNFTSAQALAAIRKTYRLRQGGGPEGYFITNSRNEVLGFTAIRDIVAAPVRMKLSEYMRPVRFLKLDPRQDQEEAIHLFSKYKVSMAPVMDKNNRLLGYIQDGDIIPLVEEEVTEDIAKMAGTGSAEFKTTSIWTTARIRFPWLIATCLGQVMVAVVIHRFNFVLSQIIALASFMPFIMAMGGNVGSQSSMILVRALAIREYDFSDRWRLLVKECLIGLLLGTVYGILIGGMAYLIYQTQFGTLFPIVIGLGTVISMTIATIIGVVGPFSLVKFGVDPATATGPIITTITDLVATGAYFLLAIWLLL